MTKIKFNLMVIFSVVLFSSPSFAGKSKVNDTLNDIKIKTEEIKFYSHKLVIDAMTATQKSEFTEKLQNALKIITESKVQILDHWNNLDRATQRQVLLEKEKPSK